MSNDDVSIPESDELNERCRNSPAARKMTARSRLHPDDQQPRPEFHARAQEALEHSDSIEPDESVATSPVPRELGALDELIANAKSVRIAYVSEDEKNPNK